MNRCYYNTFILCYYIGSVAIPALAHKGATGIVKEEDGLF